MDPVTIVGLVLMIVQGGRYIRDFLNVLLRKPSKLSSSPKETTGAIVVEVSLESEDTDVDINLTIENESRVHISLSTRRNTTLS